MPSRRFDSIDALRGIAIVWMTVFHFCFDLNHFGYLRQDFYNDPFWTSQRTAIVSLFLFCAGLGQAVAVEQLQDTKRFWKRWAQVAACALLVSAGSCVVFPQTFIYFGVLHGIALMLIIVRFTSGWGRWLWLAGAAAIGLKLAATQAHSLWPTLDFLNARPWNVLGLVSRKPQTEDYVPLIPWLGVMWWGMAAGQWLLRHRRQLLDRPIPRPAAPLAFLGRWSLSWYMLHQPLLFGIFLSLR
jgi:uncharacterized membrane protein